MQVKISDGNSKLRKTSGKVKAHLAEHGSHAGFVPRLRHTGLFLSTYQPVGTR